MTKPSSKEALSGVGSGTTSSSSGWDASKMEFTVSDVGKATGNNLSVILSTLTSIFRNQSAPYDSRLVT